MSCVSFLSWICWWCKTTFRNEIECCVCYNVGCVTCNAGRLILTVNRLWVCEIKQNSFCINLSKQQRFLWQQSFSLSAWTAADEKRKIKTVLILKFETLYKVCIVFPLSLTYVLCEKWFDSLALYIIHGGILVDA